MKLALYGFNGVEFKVIENASLKDETTAIQMAYEASSKVDMEGTGYDIAVYYYRVRGEEEAHIYCNPLMFTHEDFDKWMSEGKYEEVKDIHRTIKMKSDDELLSEKIQLILESRVKRGMEAFNKNKTARKVFEFLRERGYDEFADIMRQDVISHYILNPDVSEREVLIELQNRVLGEINEE